MRVGATTSDGNEPIITFLPLERGVGDCDLVGLLWTLTSSLKLTYFFSDFSLFDDFSTVVGVETFAAAAAASLPILLSLLICSFSASLSLNLSILLK